MTISRKNADPVEDILMNDGSQALNDPRTVEAIKSLNTPAPAHIRKHVAGGDSHPSSYDGAGASARRAKGPMKGDMNAVASETQSLWEKEDMGKKTANEALLQLSAKYGCSMYTNYLQEVSSWG